MGTLPHFKYMDLKIEIMEKIYNYKHYFYKNCNGKIDNNCSMFTCFLCKAFFFNVCKKHYGSIYYFEKKQIPICDSCHLDFKKKREILPFLFQCNTCKHSFITYDNDPQKCSFFLHADGKQNLKIMSKADWFLFLTNDTNEFSESSDED